MLPPNGFYSQFDLARQHPDRQQQDYRTAFQVDRDRLIYTTAFRRLQAKTQVFLSGEYDFYRTRLTHSLEVAQIGKSICQYLLCTSPHLRPNYFIDPDLVEAACLAHDIGHPPFGHAGERTLNRLMKDYGGFEGNAQTLRILTETIFSSGGNRRGMNPTRALLDSILKYKQLHKQLDDPGNHFLYDEQAPYLDFVLGEGNLPAHVAPDADLGKFKSIECQIMDWADDAAYRLNDIVDGVKAGFLHLQNIERWAADAELAAPQAEHLQSLLRAIREQKLESKFGGKIGDFIRACSLRETANFMSETTDRYRFILVVEATVEEEAELYGRIARDLVFRSPQLHHLEYKGDFILGRIFGTFAQHYLRQEMSKLNLVPENTRRRLDHAPSLGERARIICDYLAGMTDGYAVRTYRRLFDPEFSSLADLS